MVKELALNNFWAPVFAGSKTRVEKKTTEQSLTLWLSIILLAASVVLLGSYVYGVNQYASQGYEVKLLQNKVAELTQTNKKMSLQVSQANSMVSIQSDFLQANFVAAGTPKFLNVGQGSLTLK